MEVASSELFDATKLRPAAENILTRMAVTKEVQGESSEAAAKKVLKPNPNGVANYELPWYVVPSVKLGVGTKSSQG